MTRFSWLAMTMVGVAACGGFGGNGGNGGGGNLGPTDSGCEPAVLCGNGSYRVCRAAVGCEVRRSEGTAWPCACGRCDAAVDAAETWCATLVPASPPDMAPPSPSKIGCRGYIDCLEQEYGVNGGDPDAAQLTCDGKAKPGTRTKWEEPVGCGQAYCIGQFGQTAQCKLDSTQTRLVNLDGSAANDGTACGTCLANTLAPLFNQTCVQPTAASCNPSACRTSVDACLNDLP